MAVKIPDIGNMRTIAMIQTNVQKLSYGSANVGAGKMDKFTDFKKVRGLFYQVRGSKTLTSGDVIPIKQYKFLFRFETAINNIMSLQLRFLIEGRTYAVDSFDVDTHGRNTFFTVTLNEFGK